MTVVAEHLGADRYRIRVYAGTVRGKGRQKSRTFRAANQREANRAGAAIEAAIRDEIADEQAVNASRKGTVAELVDEWYAYQVDLGRSPKTLNRLPVMCNRIKAELGRTQVNKLTAKQIDNFYGTLRKTTTNRKKPMSESTIHHHHRVLRSILRQGEKWDMVDRSPHSKVNVPDGRTAEIAPPSDVDLERLLAALPAHVLLPIMVDARSGLRRGELFGLRWIDVAPGELHVRNNTIQVGSVLHDKEPKGKRARKIPIPVVLDSALGAHREHLERTAEALGVELAPNARVFADMEADPTGVVPMKPDWLSQYWARHCAKHGVKVRVHDLRHWCATRLIADGVPIPVVQAMLGHAQPSTTMNIYVHAVSGSEELVRKSLGR